MDVGLEMAIMGMEEDLEVRFFFSFMLLSSNDTIYVPEYMYIL